MKKTSNKKRAISAEAIARKADRGEDISNYFTNKLIRMPPLHVQRVNVDFTEPVLNELDAAARELNISRQAVIKALVRQGLDRHYMARHHRP